MSVDVIVPSRGTGSAAVMGGLLRGLGVNTPPISCVRVVVDDGRGQTRIRWEGAEASGAEFVLLLDDDVEMLPGVVQAYLDRMDEGFDAVCGSTEPKPLNGFSREVARYMTNPSTPFYAVGCTLWRREAFLRLMSEVPRDTNALLGDVVLQRRIREGGYRVSRVVEAVSYHLWDTSPRRFFEKRLKYGRAIGEMYRMEGCLPKQLGRWMAAVPLSGCRAVFLYRLATLMGMWWFTLTGDASRKEGGLDGRR